MSSSGTVLASGISVLDFPREVSFSWRLREGADGTLVMTFEREGVVSFFPVSRQYACDLAAALGVMGGIPALGVDDPLCVEDLDTALVQ